MDLTEVLGVLGFFLAVLSLGWQVRLNRPRLRVKLRGLGYATVDVGHLPEHGRPKKRTSVRAILEVANTSTRPNTVVTIEPRARQRELEPLPEGAKFTTGHDAGTTWANRTWRTPQVLHEGERQQAELAFMLTGEAKPLDTTVRVKVSVVDVHGKRYHDRCRLVHRSLNEAAQTAPSPVARGSGRLGPMQDAYVGDIGDFAKYGLLRAICGGKRLGVAWYLHPSPSATKGGRKGDGGHTQYLLDPENWQHLDPELFLTLRRLVLAGDRRVKAVEESGVLGTAVFAGELLDVRRTPVRSRAAWRKQWFERARTRLADCDLVFADPDNGLCLDESFRPTRQESAKRIPKAEVLNLVGNRPAVIYHHNSRFPGGHRMEIRSWMKRLPGCAWAYYWRRWSNRTFFILNPDSELEDRLTSFAERWKPRGELLSADL